MQKRRRMRKWIVVFCFAILPAAFFYRMFRQMETETQLNNQYYASLIGVMIDSGDSVQGIRPWKEENSQNYVLFLPSHAKAAKVSFLPDVKSGLDIRIDGRKVAAGTDVSPLEREIPLSLEFLDSEGKTAETGTLTIYESGEIASVYITTKTGKMDYIQSSKDAKEEGLMQIVTAEGQLDYEGELSAVKGRGNATWLYPKKPYNIKLKKAAGLLGLREGDGFSLLANWADKSFLRNKIAYDMAEMAGLEGTPQAEFVDLYLNGEYAGAYQLTEKIAAPEYYLMEMEISERWQDEPKGFKTDAGQAIVVKEPVNITYDEIDVISEKLQGLEDALLAQDGRNPATGRHFTQILDLDSWVRVYLVQEIMQNYDAYVSSLFMYMEDMGDSPVYCGPVWDFDWTLIGRDGTSEGVLTANQSRSPFTNYWMPPLYAQPEFYEEATKQYQQVFLPVIQEITENRIPSYEQELEASMKMNAVRWNLEGISQWREEVGKAADYLAVRAERLADIWTKPEEYYKVHVECGSDSFDSMDYYVKKGDRLTDLPEGLAREGYQFGGWFYKGTDEAFDMQLPVTGNISVEAKWTAAGEPSVLAGIRETGILQVRYLLSFLVIAVLLILITADIHKNRKRMAKKNDR